MVRIHRIAAFQSSRRLTHREEVLRIEVEELCGNGKLVNTLRVMAKPLAGGTPPEYLALVARDRPEQMLADVGPNPAFNADVQWAALRAGLRSAG